MRLLNLEYPVSQGWHNVNQYIRKESFKPMGNLHLPGIFAGVSKIIADEEISIRQAIGEDYELTENPRFIVVTESPIPDRLISKIKQVNGIRGITIY